MDTMAAPGDAVVRIELESAPNRRHGFSCCRSRKSRCQVRCRQIRIGGQGVLGRAAKSLPVVRVVQSTGAYQFTVQGGGQSSVAFCETGVGSNRLLVLIDRGNEIAARVPVATLEIQLVRRGIDDP